MSRELTLKHNGFLDERVHFELEKDGSMSICRQIPEATKPILESIKLSALEVKLLIQFYMNEDFDYQSYERWLREGK